MPSLGLSKSLVITVRNGNEYLNHFTHSSMELYLILLAAHLLRLRIPTFSTHLQIWDAKRSFRSICYFLTRSTGICQTASTNQEIALIDHSKLGEIISQIESRRTIACPVFHKQTFMWRSWLATSLDPQLLARPNQTLRRQELNSATDVIQSLLPLHDQYQIRRECFNICSDILNHTEICHYQRWRMGVVRKLIAVIACM